MINKTLLTIAREILHIEALQNQVVRLRPRDYRVVSEEQQESSHPGRVDRVHDVADVSRPRDA